MLRAATGACMGLCMGSHSVRCRLRGVYSASRQPVTLVKLTMTRTISVRLGGVLRFTWVVVWGFT